MMTDKDPFDTVFQITLRNNTLSPDKPHRERGKIIKLRYGLAEKDPHCRKQENSIIRDVSGRSRESTSKLKTFKLLKS